MAEISVARFFLCIRMACTLALRTLSFGRRRSGRSQTRRHAPVDRLLQTIEPLEPRLLLSASGLPQFEPAPAPSIAAIELPQFSLMETVDALGSLDVSSQTVNDLYADGLRGAVWGGQEIVVDTGRWVVDFSIFDGEPDSQFAQAQALVGSQFADAEVTRHLGSSGLFLVETPTDLDYGLFTSSLLAIDIRASGSSPTSSWRCVTRRPMCRTTRWSATNGRGA